MNEKEKARQARFLANHALPDSVVRGLDSTAASTAAGIAVDAPALDYPNAGWVKPIELCAHLATTPGVTFQQGEVKALHASATGWTLTLASGNIIEADQVVIASASEAAGYAETAALPLQPVRGQISQLTLPADAPPLRRVVCAGGYVPPAADGVLNFGATFHPGDADPREREADHAANLAELERGMPALFTALRNAGAKLTPEQLAGRTGIRAASPDKTPYAGPVPDAEAWRNDYASLVKDATRIPDIPGRHYPGLWISSAHGSRGLSSAPLCG